MKIFTWNDILTSLNEGTEIEYFGQGTGISTGSFDGLHKGHRKLIKQLVENCKNFQLISGAVTFTRPLPSIKHSSDYLGDISTLKQRLTLLEELGLEFVILVDFDESFASMMGSDYFTLLMNVCNMKYIAEGVDFRCGYKGSTDSSAIKYFAEQNNLRSDFVNPVFYKEGTDLEERISSSYIREMVKKGFFTTVKELLERNYELDFSDIESSNCVIEKSKVRQVIPKNGVYYCNNENGENLRVIIDDRSIKTEKKVQKITFR